MKSSSQSLTFASMVQSWQRRELAQSLILSGPITDVDGYADMLQRLLLCEREGDEGCTCRSCTTELSHHPDRLMLTPNLKTIRRDDTERTVSLLSSRPLWAPAKIVVIRPADTLGHEAESYLLKHLEEPRDYVYYLLLTDAPEALIRTIRSRCQQWRFLRRESAAVESLETIEQLLQNPPTMDAVVKAAYWVRKQYLHSGEMHWLSAWDTLRQVYQDLEANGNTELALARIRRALLLSSMT